MTTDAANPSTDKATSSETAEEASADSPPVQEVVKKGPKRKYYTLRPGDHPGKVAKEQLGRASRARELYRLNPGAKWVPGTKIEMP